MTGGEHSVLLMIIAIMTGQSGGNIKTVAWNIKYILIISKDITSITFLEFFKISDSQLFSVSRKIFTDLYGFRENPPIYRFFCLARKRILEGFFGKFS